MCDWKDREADLLTGGRDMIPVSKACAVAEECDQTMVVILGYNPHRDRTSLATYGVTATDKARAVEVGDRIAGQLGFHQADEAYEDYRRPGERAEAFDALLKSCKAAVHAYRSLRAVRDGLTDDFLESLHNTALEAIRKAEPSENT